MGSKKSKVVDEEVLRDYNILRDDGKADSSIKKEKAVTWMITCSTCGIIYHYNSPSTQYKCPYDSSHDAVKSRVVAL